MLARRSAHEQAVDWMRGLCCLCPGCLLKPPPTLPSPQLFASEIWPFQATNCPSCWLRGLCCLCPGRLAPPHCALTQNFHPTSSHKNLAALSHKLSKLQQFGRFKNCPNSGCKAPLPSPAIWTVGGLKRPNFGCEEAKFGMRRGGVRGDSGP